MSDGAAKPLFVDTGAFYAFFLRNSSRHEHAQSVFGGIRDGTLRFKPLYTSGATLGELATLIQRKKNRETAIDTLRRIDTLERLHVLHADATDFERAREQFERYDDQQISFVDHTNAVLAEERDVAKMFAFDSDYRTLGFGLVPEDLDQ